MDYSQTSMVDVAYDIMEGLKAPIDFYELWEQVAEKKNFTAEERDENESVFYTNITLDGRMITVGENRWDLRERHKFEDVHIDMNDVYSDDEEEEEETDDGSIEDSYSDD
ncbi:MAG: DNA-directed RNA polymerase subunit delta [Intestinibaculum porci]|jgi:DNA-directed RNA polymerase subunit delta|uniref:DNA-directed RNA polymerase subunit delta n=1 Tax=Intestinibaculum porci TaxID=2487118 RepID=UPI000ED658A8|nr:DNA-directed RNA polymerase subunit delta [Intestinibaculum porci]MDD6422390.1 DNA-directed RNA polymerase subunit delta [Intestinibaculum porci]HAN58294.1 DNA-directed RNA polymerase subunit delta [Erysipelotrichaceae bacterium]